MELEETGSQQYQTDHMGKLFEQGFDLYQNQRFEEALPLFCRCLELVAEDTVAALYVERCQILISGGWNTETWDGVNRMETK